MTATARAAAIRGRNAFQLASTAGVASPDALDSAGAEFLTGVAESVAEAIEGDYLTEDTAAEVADGAVPVYTHTRWLAFVDLAAYSEDGDDVGGFSDDLTEAAGQALYLIAARLVDALLDETADDDDEPADD